jgi:ligand-binding sensor domain-containing protein
MKLLTNIKSKISIRIYIGIFFICISIPVLHSQVPELQLKYFSRNDGLLNNNVGQVVQDSTGFIWVASRNGLYKYDGYTFTPYFSNQNDNSSLSNNYINNLYVDKKGRLWIGTRLGVCRYNEDYDNFDKFPAFLKYSPIAGQNITQIGEDKQGNILITCNQYIYRYNEKANEFSCVLKLESGMINYFVVDKYNRIWIACSENNGLKSYNLNTNKWELIPDYQSETNVLNNLTISHLSIDSDNLWIASFGKGIFRLDINTMQIVNYLTVSTEEALSIYIYVDNDKNVWTIDFSGLKILDRKSNHFIRNYSTLNNPNKIRGALKGIIQDKQGNYWFFHEPGGLAISMITKGFRFFNSEPNNSWHTLSNNITSIEEDKYGNLWIGNGDGGITFFNWKKGVIKNFIHSSTDKYCIGMGSVLCIFHDSKGVVWVSSYLGGLQYFDESRQKFISLSHDPKNPESIAGPDIRSIVEDKDGNLWMAVHGRGVDKYDRKKNIFIHYNNQQNNLSNNWTFKLLLDKDENLWVTTGWGLNLLKKGEKTFKAFLSDENDSTSISDNQINTILMDSQSAIWVGTSQGLNRYNPEKNNFTRYSNAFKSNNISGILDDKDNNIWVSTLSGISMLNYKTKQVVNFSSIDGLISEEFNVNCCLKTGNNELFFGGTNGMVLFNPQKLKFNKIEPKVIIDKFKIINKEIKVNGNDGILEKQIGKSKKITLKYSDKVITIGFKALNFINPQRNQYAYKLENFDKEWNYVGTQTEANYTNLDPGLYVFKVIASNNDGFWNTEGVELIIEVNPPWYGTLAFKIGVLMVLIFLVLGYIRIRTSSLQKQKERLEKAVQKQTSELHDKNHLLEQQSEELKIQTENLHLANTELTSINQTKDKLLSIIAHDISNPFSTIIGFSELLYSDYKLIDDNEKHSYAENIYISSQKVNDLLKSLLLWANSQANGIGFNPQTIQMNQLVMQTVELSLQNIRLKEINLVVECKPDINAWADLDMAKAICRNLLNNAIKFTPHLGNIRFEVIKRQEMINVSVSDDGIGMNKEKIEYLLNSKIVKPEYGTDGEKGIGLGLSICKDFIKRNGGEFSITSSEGMGSIFSFSLPVSYEF